MKTILIAFLTLLVCSVAFAGGQDEEVTEKPIVMKVGATAAASMDHPEYASLMTFKEVIENESNGKLIVEIYPANLLRKTTEIVEGTSIGTIEAVNAGYDSIATIYPPISVFSLPYLFKDIDHVKRVFKSPAGSALLEKMASEVGLRAVGVLYRGPRHLMSSKKAVYTPEDLVGQKIRVPGNPLNQETLKVMGATPVAIDWAEIYTALSQKVVDGYENPIDIFYESKGHETMKYLSLTGHMQSPIPIVVSEKFFKGLSQELKDSILLGGKAAEEHRLKLLENSESKALSVFKDAGIQVNEVDFQAFQEATKDVYKKFVDKFGEDVYQSIKAVQ